MYGVFDTFKIGLGPSSSHTMGPMLAAARFREHLAKCVAAQPKLRQSIRVCCSLHGSLGATGSGHGSINAIITGLAGYHPAHIDHRAVATIAEQVHMAGQIEAPDGTHWLFQPATDISLCDSRLPLHSNGLTFEARDAAEPGAILLQETYYSIGGGVIADITGKPIHANDNEVPIHFSSATQLLSLCHKLEISISELARQNELSLRTAESVSQGIAEVWRVMAQSIAAGLAASGELPGGLGVRRRAAAMHRQLLGGDASGIFDRDQRAVAYAMAVNEENACGHRVVTAPTNGAAGIIPSVLQFCIDDLPPSSHTAVIERFMLTAAAIGSLFKRNASISGAEVGCQGEVGAASSMAAAGLAEVWGGTPEQVEHAAEIALEHNLGLTCDPIGGFVQIPCIERNGMGAMKAITAARIALTENGEHVVSLDAAIETMRLTGLDMNDKYKETAQGGLAITGLRIPVTQVDC